MQNTLFTLGKPRIALWLSTRTTSQSFAPMQRHHTHIKPRRSVETAFTPGGFGGAPKSAKASHPRLVARWIVSEEGQMSCQWERQ